jgi:outer membrane lipoprotein SlyB
MPDLSTLRRAVAAPLALGALALVTACASPGYSERTVYDAPRPMARPAVTEYGQVREIDIVHTSRRTSGAGAVIGAILGGVVGNQFGGGSGRGALTVGGAVAGAVAGNAVEDRRNRRDDEVYRVTVRFENGTVREFDFHQIDDLRVGDRVRWENGQLYRS